MTQSPDTSPQSSFFDITSQLNANHPLLMLAEELDWHTLEENLSDYYSDKGRPAKPLRLMSGMLMLKSLYNHSDESLIDQWLMNPYYQVFCGMTSFQTRIPCHSTELVKFRNRIGQKGVDQIFSLSVKLHGRLSEEKTVLVDTTVQEKAITYPTDMKLAIKIINRLNKLAKAHGIKQRRTYVKEVKSLRLACRHFRHVKVRAKARKALKRLRTIVGILMRELERQLPVEVLETQRPYFDLYTKVINQKRNDKDKVYSLHEPDVYCVGKGKDHKAYEYGRKASVVATAKSGVIVGVQSHDEHLHDSKTLKSAIAHANSHREKDIELAVVDRGYRGAKKHVECDVLLPSKPLKKDTPYERQKKRELCRKRAGIEPIIGHLKHDYRLSRNWLKGSQGDAINLLMAACAWNLKKWMVAFLCVQNNQLIDIIIVIYSPQHQMTIVTIQIDHQ